MIPGDTLLPISANLIGSGSGALQIPHHHVDPSGANPNPNHLMRHQDHGSHNTHQQMQQQQAQTSQHQQQLPPPPAPPKKKRNLPGTPDPDSEVVSLSPGTLMATNRFVCEICGKGFQRDQNLQLHRRGHNLPWKLRQRPSVKDGAPPPRKKVYVCPEKTCVHNDPSRALGDLTGIKKHFSRKHGEKKWKCDKCSKKYAVQSDWKAHAKTCGTREYKCDCGTIFSRKDSFITHRAFCDALMEETTKYTAATASTNAIAPYVAGNNTQLLSGYGAGQAALLNPHDMAQMHASPDGRSQKQDDLSLAWLDHQAAAATNALLSNSMDMPPGGPSYLQQTPCSTSLSSADMLHMGDGSGGTGYTHLSMYDTTSPLASVHMSATALLQKAAHMGATMSSPPASTFAGFGGLMLPRTKNMLPQRQQPNCGRNEMEAANMAMNKPTHPGASLLLHDSIQHITTSNTAPAVSQQASALEAKYGNLIWGTSSNVDQLLGGGADLTRDFLGLGGAGAGGGPGDQHHHHQLAQAGRPFSAEELTRLASIESGMDAISSAAYGSYRR